MWVVPINSNYILCLYQWGMENGCVGWWGYYITDRGSHQPGLLSTRESPVIRDRRKMSHFQNHSVLSKRTKATWIFIDWAWFDSWDLKNEHADQSTTNWSSYRAHAGFTQPLPKNRFGSSSVLEKCKLKLYFSGGQNINVCTQIKVMRALLTRTDLKQPGSHKENQRIENNVFVTYCIQNKSVHLFVYLILQPN